MKNKKILCYAWAVLICLSIASCGPEKEPVPETPDTPTPEVPNDPAEKPDTNVTEKPDTTETPDVPETPPFKLKVYDVTSVMATVEVEPEDKTAPYYMDILPEGDFLQTLEYGFDDYMAWFLENMMKQTGQSLDEVVTMISSHGNDGFIVTTLNPESKYYAVAVGIGEDGMTTTDVVSQEFTTSARIVSENTFGISISEITAATAIVNVETANDDPYILTIEPYSTTMDLDDEELTEYIIQNNMAWGGLQAMTYTGDAELEHLGKAGWEYEAIAFGYEDGAPTTDVTRVLFTMDDGSSTQDCTFEFGQEFDTFNMHLSVKPSDNSVVYVTNVISTEELAALEAECTSREEALAKNLELLIEELIADCGSRARVIELISLMESQSYSLKYKPSTEYIQWAVPIDQDGYPTAGFSCSEPFTTPAEVVSSASLTLKEYKVFNGTELAAIDPGRFKTAKGYAVVDMTVEASEDAVSWWSYIAMENLTDRPKETIIKNLHGAPTQPNLTRQVILAFWGTNTIMGVAQDAEGNYGELLLEVVNLSEDKTLPANAFQF